MYYTTFAKVASILNEIDVTSTSNGTLLMNGVQWVEVAPLIFRPYGSPSALNNSLVFREDAQGQITYFFLSNNVPSAYERVPWYETAFSLLA